MEKDKLHHIRTDYESTPLTKRDLDGNPMQQFSKWFTQSLADEVPDANAFCLATVSKDRKPSNRVVLLKEIREEGIVFFTNYTSQKGEEIAQNPNVAACFFWQPQGRQVRIEGVCEKISPQASDEYFNKRPLLSKIGAITSPQSKTIPSREWLDQEWKKNEEKWGKSIKRPEFWGGYLIVANRFEFWQGQIGRLHDRFAYTQDPKTLAWKCERLAP